MLGTVHWVITPFALLSKGMALARDKQESRRATETAALNMAKEGGGREGNKTVHKRTMSS